MQILILGMHQSGASMVARLLNMMGVYFAPEGASIGANQDNPKNFWERRDARALNDVVLYSAGAEWHRLSRFSLENVPPANLAQFREEAAKMILAMDAHRPWFLKEPRLCLLAPLWLELLEFPVCIFVTRSPLEVAKSLETRNGLSLALGLALWERYNAAALNAMRGYRRIQIDHGDLITDPVATVRRLHQELEALDVRGLGAPSDQEIRAVIDLSLYGARGKGIRHHLSPAQRKLRDAIHSGKALLSEKEIRFSAESQEVLSQHDRWMDAQEAIAHLVSEGADLKKKLYRRQKELQEAKRESQQEGQKLRGKISQQAASIAHYQRRIEKLRELLSRAGKLLDRALTSSRWRIGSLVLLRSRKFAGESDPHWRKRLLGEYKAWAQQEGDYSSVDPAGSRDNPSYVPRYRSGRLQFAKGKPVLLLCAHSCGHQLYGAERCFVDTLEALRALDVNVFVTLPRTSNAKYLDAVGQRSVGVYTLPYRQWDRSPESDAVVKQFTEIIERHGISVVHANTIMLREPLTAARRRGVTTVIHAHEIIRQDETLAGQIGLSAEEIVSQVVARSDYIIANSEATANCFGRMKPLHVAPNAIDIDSLDLPNIVDRSAIRFGLVSGKLSANKKGFYDFMDLARRCETIAPNAQFLIIGHKVPDIGALAGKTPPNVKFVGYRETPREVMAETNVILNLSHFAESFGRTVAEAMAARRPVIAYRWGALPEIIRDGKTGFLVSYRNLDELTARVKELCENPDVIVEMGQRGRSFVSSRYSPHLFRERLGDAYSHILNVSPPMAREPVKIWDNELVRSAPRTAIVIAVHNAYEELQQCIASVLGNTNLTKNRLIVIDDASTDARIPKFFKELADVEYVRNDQVLGYTRTCNKGISLAAPCDVVLLNSDTIVTPRWLESLRLAAYSAPTIGTATPLSDNAGAFSMPAPNQQNPKPEGMEHAEYARLMRRLCGGCALPYVPTGNGFCLFIKRKLISEIGAFDEEAFPRGYGEENDFCMRAEKTGWRNVIAPTSFVFHHSNASFREEKEQLLAAGLRVVRTRYPDYARRVKEAFSHSTMEKLRASAQKAADAAVMATSVETRVAVCTSSAAVAQVQCDNGEWRFVVSCAWNQISLPEADAMMGEEITQVSRGQNFAQEFGTWLLRCGIDRVELESLENLPFDPTEVCRLFGISFSIGQSATFLDKIPEMSPVPPSLVRAEQAPHPRIGSRIPGGPDVGRTGNSENAFH